METLNKNELRDFTDDIKEYVNVRLQIIRLNVTEKVAFTLSNFISNSILLIAGLFFVLFLSLAGGFALSILLDSYTLGFIAVAGFYLLVLIVVKFIFSKGVKIGLTNLFIKDFTNDDDDDGKGK
ncbi:MAG: phage holin family protein [Chitinophagales bacterium]|nr:phage holin family protein [Bacteroidota bacterium]